MHDSVSHPLVQDNLAVTDLGVAAYLGMPIADSAGIVIGSLCVIEHQPRRWFEADLNVLTDLAYLVQRELAEKSNADDLATDERTWRDVLNGLPVLIFLASSEGQSVGYNTGWHEFTGSSPAALADWLSYCHPDDRALAEAGWYRAQSLGQPWQAELRLHHISGAYRQVIVDAFPLRRDNGAIRLWVGCCTDISVSRALRAQAEEIKTTLAKMLIDTLSTQATWAPDDKFREIRGLIATVRELSGVTTE